MTTPRPSGLVEGTLADLRTLMSKPPYPRRGNAYLEPEPQPAAGAGFTHKVDSAWWERLVSLYFTFAATGGTVPREVAINLSNGDGTVFNSTPAIVQAQPGETWNVSADLSGTYAGPGGTSEGAAGTVTSPAAGATIASVTVGPGLWTMNWNVSLSGTVGAPEQNNFKAVITGVNLGNSDNPASVGGPWSQAPVQFEAPAGGTTAAIKTSVLATTGAVYDGAFTVAPVAAATTYPQLPDITLKSGWSWGVTITGVQAGDQLSGIIALCERYPSNWADGSLAEDAEALARFYGW